MGIRDWLANALARGAPNVLRVDGPNVASREDKPLSDSDLLALYREWVYNCVTKNAEAVSATPLRLYTTSKPGAVPGSRMGRKTPHRLLRDRERAALGKRAHLVKYLRDSQDAVEILDHPFLDLWERGNPFLTSSQQKRVIVMHLDLVGDAFLYVETDKYGPVHLMVVPPETMRAVARGDHRGIAYYEQSTKQTQTPERLSPDDIVHFKHPNPRNVLNGMSPLEGVGLVAELYHDYNQFELALINNDGTPSTLIRTEQRMTEAQKRREERRWFQKHGRPTQKGKLAFVSGVTGIDRIGFSQRDMMFQVGRKLAREDIAGAFSVPMPLLVSDGSNLAHAHDAEKHHARYAIRPRCTLIEEQINRDLLPKYEGGDGLFVAFDDPVPEDRAHNLERAKVMISSSELVYKNEARAALELDADPAMDDETIGTDMLGGLFGGGGAPRPDPDASDDTEPDDDETPMDDAGERGVKLASKFFGCGTAHKAAPPAPRDFTDALASLFDEQSGIILNNLKRTRSRVKYIVDPAVVSSLDPDEWAARFFSALKPHLQRQLVDGANEGLGRIGSPISFDVQRPEIANFIADYTYRFSFAVNATTQGDLRKLFTVAERDGLTLAETTSKVEDYFGYAKRYRAARTARTETVRARMGGELEAWKQSGVVSGYYWETASGNPCEYCKSVEAQFGRNGTHLTFGQNFFDRGNSVGVEGQPPLMLDYSDIPHPPLHPNCGCELVPILVGEE